MAHFRGTLNGMGGTATRLGNETSGLLASAYGWDGAVTVRLSVRNNRDYAIVTLWSGPNKETGPSLQLWEGYIDAAGRKSYENWSE